MTKNTKIILGLSGLALAYFVYTKNKGKKKSNNANFSNLSGGRSCVRLNCPCGCKNDGYGVGHCTPISLCKQGTITN